MNLQEILATLDALPDNERQKLEKIASETVGHLQWIPNPGPQTEAYLSEADVVLFGGSPGGGKSSLGIGLALNSHYRSLIVRVAFAHLEGLIDTAKKFVGGDDGFVGGNRPKYRKPDGGVIHFAGLSDDGKLGGHQGVDHDYIYIDEAAQFSERAVRTIMGWLRTDRPSQRCRVVMGSNPPLDSTGDWLIDYFGPWLDERYPNPAKPGELRYFLPGPDGKDYECQKGDTAVIQGVTVHAQSRTYIPSSFTDNPFYNATEYAKQLGAMDATIRNRLISGNFMMARNDPDDQVIPTEWIRLAQKRWVQVPPPGVPMCVIAADVARGGGDKTVLSWRHDGWFSPLISVPGEQTPTGNEVAAMIVMHRRDNARVVIDMGGGYGGSPKDKLNENGIEVTAYNGAAGSAARSRCGTFRFVNKRAESYWKLREALDPAGEFPGAICLPDDPELLADLAAARFTVTAGGIKIESKEDIRERIGRSPDKGDAVLMAWQDGQHIRNGSRVGNGRFGSLPTTANLGYGNRKRYGK
jgi:hypothetical protein